MRIDSRLAVALIGLTVISLLSISSDGNTCSSLADQSVLDRELLILRDSNNSHGTNDQPTIEKLKKLYVENVTWANVKLDSAMTDLATKTVEVDPTHVGLQFRICVPADPKQKDVLGRTFQQNICIVLKDRTSLFDLLIKISQQTNLSFGVKKNAVVFQQWKPDFFIWLSLVS